MPFDFNPPPSPGDYISDADYTSQMRAQYVDAESGRVIASSRLVPSKVVIPSVGSWMIDGFRSLHGREVSVLCEVNPSELLVSEYEVEMNYEGRRWDAERYAEWMRSGLVPPPISVVQITDGTGRLKVSNGHRRRAAAILAGTPILAWVSPVMEHPERLVDTSTNRTMLTGMTYEGVWGCEYGQRPPPPLPSRSGSATHAL